MFPNTISAKNSSKVSSNTNHINRNIDENYSGEYADIEISTMDSPKSNKQDEHEAAITEAWHFISEVRRKNGFLYPDTYRHQNCGENAKNDNMNSTYVKNNNLYDKDEAETNLIQDRKRCFTAINRYLDELENLSEAESLETEQNYFNEHEQRDAIAVYDSTILAASDEGPVFIYSFKNKNYISDNGENLPNSPDKECYSSGTSSVSVENFNDELLSYEKSFFRISSSFQPVTIPRLPLGYMLPTVAEIYEPKERSPKVIEIAHDENVSVKTKPINSWVITESPNHDRSNSENNESDRNCDNWPTDKSSANYKKETFYKHNIDNLQQSDIKYQSETRNTNREKSVTISNSNSIQSKLSSESRKCSGKSIYSTHNKVIYKKPNEIDLDALDIDSISTESVQKDSIRSENRNSSTNQITEFISENSSIPTLHLSLNTENDTSKPSWFKRFIKCISCCK